MKDINLQIQESKATINKMTEHFSQTAESQRQEDALKTGDRRTVF